MMDFITNHQEWFKTIISTMVGSTITIISAMLWDKHKNKNKFKELLKTILLELKENKKRFNKTLESLPPDVKTKMENWDIKDDMDSGVFLTYDEISKLSWSFPKPYSVGAWKTFVLSGLAVNLDPELFRPLYRIYDLIDSINFLGDLSVKIFQILSQTNRLDNETNKNFDQFCKFGTKSQEITASKIIDEIIKRLEDVLD